LTTALHTKPGGLGVIARTILLCMALFTSSWGAWAHGGEDHGEAVAPVASVGMSPRASAQTEEFELVAQAQGTRLVLTLDRFATNAPVVDAQIEVESGSVLKQTAKQISPGVYVVQGTPFGAPGSYPLSFFVQAGDTSDLMATTLEITPPIPNADHAHSGVKWAAWATWAVAAAVLMLGLIFVLLRRRNRIRQYAP
jgi:phosphate/sulfate permease